MSMLAPSILWLPRVGDYARVRHDGLLGEVIDIARKGDDRQYTLNLFAQDTNAPLVCRLDDLEPIWPDQSEGDGHHGLDDDAPFAWGSS